MKTSLLAIAVIAAIALVAIPARATTTYALTNGGQILTFDHLTPSVITRTVTPDAAVVGAYTLLAIDIRPTVQTNIPAANPGVGTLWAIGRLGTDYRLFVIDPVTGAATAIGIPYSAAQIPSAAGVNTWGFDFNPTVDRIRLVNSAATTNNYRLNPNASNGVIAADDPELSFAGGDPNFGTVPQIDAGAYTTAAFGGTTSLFYIDTNLDILARAVDANAGTLQTVGSLGVPILGEPNGFDIFNSLALFSVSDGLNSLLYSVNLTSGAATFAGNIGVGTNVRGLAISISDPVPPPPVNLAPQLRVFGKDKRTVKVTPPLVRGTATDESGVVALSYRVANRSSSYLGAPYANPFSIKVRRLAFGENRVIIRATDPTGNITEKRLVIVRRR